MLELKLSEECTEYQIDKNTEALADILEVSVDYLLGREN